MYLPPFIWDFMKLHLIDGGNSNGLENVHPDFWGNDAIWRANIFQTGWWTNQLLNLLSPSRQRKLNMFANLVECQWSWQGYVTVNDRVLTAMLALTRDTVTYPSIQWSLFFRTNRQDESKNVHQVPPISPILGILAQHNPPTTETRHVLFAHWTLSDRCEWISKTWPLFSWTNGSWKSWILGSQEKKHGICGSFLEKFWKRIHLKNMVLPNLLQVRFGTLSKNIWVRFSSFCLNTDFQLMVAGKKMFGSVGSKLFGCIVSVSFLDASQKDVNKLFPLTRDVQLE